MTEDFTNQRPPINKYPDEPHPDNEYEWKKWFVQKLFKPDDMVPVQWLHRCWVETKARWCQPSTT